MTKFWNESAEGAEDDNYKKFVDKFKPKKTTDDCYTPDLVYDVVRDWAVRRYDLKGAEIIRPFYPGGDYENAEYPANCVVIDNPPFSILSKIVRFYMSRGIRFFLFAPALSLFSCAAGEANYIPAFCDLTYDNGANVKTSFVTNMGEYKIDTAPDLYEQVTAAMKKTLKDKRPAELPKYEYPENVITAARLSRFVKGGADIKIRPEDCRFIRGMDCGVKIFGSAFLISDAAAEKAAAEKAAAEKAAAEKAAAEKAAAEKAAIYWPLSETERKIISNLGRKAEP
jgi:hypothetical protein